MSLFTENSFFLIQYILITISPPPISPRSSSLPYSPKSKSFSFLLEYKQTSKNNVNNIRLKTKNCAKWIRKRKKRKDKKHTQTHSHTETIKTKSEYISKIVRPKTKTKQQQPLPIPPPCKNTSKVLLLGQKPVLRCGLCIQGDSVREN